MGRVISFTHSGDFKKTSRFLSGLQHVIQTNKLHHYGELGVEALSRATPRDTGKTAQSWGYEIEEKPGSITIYWRNSHVERGVNIALILDMGHATRNGGFIEGLHYIDPAIQPVFEKMANEVWREVTEG